MKGSKLQDYDEIAANYDEMFSDDASLQENDDIKVLLSRALLGKREKIVIDVGAGTGLFLDLIPTHKSKYIGIEPSQKMIDKFKGKHPTHSILQMKLEELVSVPIDAVFICLFGGVNYVDPDFINKNSLLMQHHHFFLMFFNEGYNPLVCIKSGIDIAHYSTSDYDLPPHTVIEFGNYLILTNLL